MSAWIATRDELPLLHTVVFICWAGSDSKRVMLGTLGENRPMGVFARHVWRGDGVRSMSNPPTHWAYPPKHIDEEDDDG